LLVSTGAAGKGGADSLTRSPQAQSVSIASNAAVFFIGPIPELFGDLRGLLFSSLVLLGFGVQLSPIVDSCSVIALVGSFPVIAVVDQPEPRQSAGNAEPAHETYFAAEAL
jgi:hypothetical protein